MSLAKLLNQQTGIHVSHEGIPYLPWDRSLYSLFWGMFEVVGRKTEIVGDVAFYWINYVDWIFEHIDSEARFICLQRNRDDTVDSFMRMTAAHDRNHWTRDRHVRGNTVEPYADRAFPKYHGTKEEALGLYWDEYYRTATGLQKKYPDNFRIFPMDDLNDIDRTKKLLLFAGVSCDWQLTTTHANTFKRLAIIVGIRAPEGEPWRETNAMECLRALNDQSAPRDRYKIVLVEEDSQQRVSEELKAIVDQYVFLPSDTLYNRSRVLNHGCSVAGLREDDILCLMDADLLVDVDFVKRCISKMRGDTQAVLPYEKVKYMNADATVVAQKDRRERQELDAGDFTGLTSVSHGGSLWIRAGLYSQLGGHDERFVGWGCEDSDFWWRLQDAIVKVHRVKGVMLHMWHPEVERGDAHVRNRRLYAQLHPDKLRRGHGTEALAAAVDVDEDKQEVAL